MRRQCVTFDMWRRLDPSDPQTRVALARALTVRNDWGDGLSTEGGSLEDGNACKEGEEGEKLNNSRSGMHHGDPRSADLRGQEAGGTTEVRGREGAGERGEFAAGSSWRDQADGVQQQQDKGDVLAWVRLKEP